MDWPDRGVPPADMSAIFLLNKIRVTTSVPSSHEDETYSTPIIVHCSAGIGRTGSIVLIEYTLETLLAGKEIRNMNELLTNLRKQRAASVQTDLQVPPPSPQTSLSISTCTRCCSSTSARTSSSTRLATSRPTSSASRRTMCAPRPELPLPCKNRQNKDLAPKICTTVASLLEITI